MELRQLEYLVAVAEEASFTRAAQRVHISQSGVSAQVRQLEHELGAELFDRSARAATLTRAGEAALGHAREALAAAAAMRQAVDDVNGLLRGRLRVGMVTACTITGLFDALDAFHRAHPGVVVTLLEHGSAELTDQVRAGVIDLALIGVPGEAPEGLAALPIVSERLVAAFPAAHPLAGAPHGVSSGAPQGVSSGAPQGVSSGVPPGAASLTLDDLARLPLICMPGGTGIRAVFDQACAARGIQATVTLEASAASVLADLAARGLGVAILSESMAAAAGDRLRVVPIDGCDTPALLALIWRPSPPAAVAELVRHCRRAFAVDGS
jgi:DNA-binding transcriptional LysR family regulator